MKDESVALFGPPTPDLRVAVEALLSAIALSKETDDKKETEATMHAFFTHLARHAKTSDAPILEVLASMRAADLWLAFQCSLGEAAAIKTFHERYDDDIRRALGGVRVVAMDVDDLAQELARRMFVGPEPKIREYSGRGDLRAWVRIVATRLSLDIARAKKNTADTPTDDSRFATMAAPANDNAPEQAYFRRLYRKEVAEAIEHAVRTLDAEERNALREHYARGLSVDQIAAIHGIHRATAARRVQKARETLVGAVKRLLDERHGLRGHDLASVMGLVRSQMHLTMDRVLASQ